MSEQWPRVGVQTDPTRVSIAIAHHGRCAVPLFDHAAVGVQDLRGPSVLVMETAEDRAAALANT